MAAAALLLGAVGCGHHARPTAQPGPVVAAGISRAEIDRLWDQAVALYRQGKWAKSATVLERVILELPAGDSLIPQAHFRLAECYFGQKNQLQAAREFRKVSDDTPNATLAPDALLRAGDAYGDLWRRPELDDTYGQTARSTYQELLNRYPDTPAAAQARLRISDLEESFAQKEYKTAQFYLRLRAWDSAILYLKDLAATYPRAQVTPAALLKLVGAYRAVGYPEDLQETCGYIRRFHPTTPGLDAACPAPTESNPPPPPAGAPAGSN
jgi:outer membrane protein assembly factor BamD